MQQPVKFMACDAADFVPAAPAWQAQGGAAQHAGQYEGWPEDSQQQHQQEQQQQEHQYSEYGQQGYFGEESEHGYYGTGRGGEQHGDWDPQQHGQAGQWPEGEWAAEEWPEEAGANAQWRGEGSPGADREALGQQFSGLRVDQADGGDGEEDSGDWLLMCEVRGWFVFKLPSNPICCGVRFRAASRQARVSHVWPFGTLLTGCLACHPSTVNVPTAPVSRTDLRQVRAGA